MERFGLAGAVLLIILVVLALVGLVALLRGEAF
jgi:hypothetical protein